MPAPGIRVIERSNPNGLQKQNFEKVSKNPLNVINENSERSSLIPSASDDFDDEKKNLERKRT